MANIDWKIDPDKNQYLDDFIRGYCSTIKEIHLSQPYVSFGLISAGIEFLGKCLDETTEFSDYRSGLTKRQFNVAISQLFPSYINANNTFDLYSNLRNGFFHALIPKPTIWLRQRHTTQFEHLSIHNIQGGERLVIIIENFYSDFENACNAVIFKIENDELSHPKIKRPYMVVKE